MMIILLLVVVVAVIQISTIVFALFFVSASASGPIINLDPLLNQGGAANCDEVRKKLSAAREVIYKIGEASANPGYFSVIGHGIAPDILGMNPLDRFAPINVIYSFLAYSTDQLFFSKQASCRLLPPSSFQCLKSSSSLRLKQAGF